MHLLRRGFLSLVALLLGTAAGRAQTAPVFSIFSPTDRVFVLGSSDSLVVRPFSGTPPLSYQWFKAGVAIAGATGADLEFPTVTPNAEGKYSVRVSNAAGSVTSREVTVTVVPATPIAITSPPRPLTVTAGQPATFDVSFNGSPNYTFQWLKNGTPVAGATNRSLTLAAASPADAGNYSVVITNVAGAATTTAATLIITAATPPGIVNEPQSTTATEGREFSFTVVASGSAPLSYQWYLNGQPIASDSTSSSFAKAARMSDAGNYHVVVTNAGGAASSRPATLTVNPLPPPPVIQLPSQAPFARQPFALSAPFPAEESATYQWYHDGQPIRGANAPSFGLANARTEDAGEYFAVVTNSAGATTSLTASVSVLQRSAPEPGAWVAAERQGDIAYFAFASPARIERFHLATENWLPAIPLARAPEAFTVGGNAFYVAAGSVVYRYALDGSDERVLHSAFPTNLAGLVLAGEYLFAQHGGYANTVLNTIRLSDGAKVSTVNYGYDWGPSMVAAPGQQRLFSLKLGTSTSVVSSATYQSNGLLPFRTGIEGQGSFPAGRRVFLSPNESLVADDGGCLYRTSDLQVISGLGGAFDDLVFTSANLPVVLRSGRVVTFNATFGVAGEIATGIAAARIFLQGGNVFAFGYPPSSGAVRPAKIALAPATANLPAPVDPDTPMPTPDAVFLDRDGIAYLYSKLYRHIFRWSPAERRYLSPVRLPGWPNHVAYSSATHRLYLGYSASRIHQVRLDTGSLAEEPFITAPQQVFNLTTAGEHVFVVNNNGSNLRHLVCGPDGTVISQLPEIFTRSEYAWNPILRRMYMVRGSVPGILAYSELSPAGALSEPKDSFSGPRLDLNGPLRVSPEGSVVFSGSGKLVDARALVTIGSLANSVDDAVWVGNRLITARNLAAGAELQRWGGPNYAQDRTRVIAGRLLRIFALAGARVLAITFRDGQPIFTLLDENLAELSSTSATVRSRLANLATRALAGRNEQMLIPGFVIAGPLPKRVLIRAAGPALAAFGVTGALADPRLTVFNQAGTAVATNDDWSSTTNVAEVRAVTSRVGAFGFANASRDAAALITLDPGAYTVQTSGASEAAGVALVEVYDAQDPGNPSRLVNLAARAQVGSGADVLIPGIVVQGGSPRTLLLRAVGPGLAAFGVSGTLANPRLRLFRGEQPIADNDDWGQSADAPAIAAAALQSGAFALAPNSRDAALLITLAPGAYTAQVSGADGGMGVALVEVYEVGN